LEGKPVNLSIEIDSAPEDLTILTLEGSADFYTSPLLNDCLADLIGAGRDRLVVDLGAVRFLDTAAREVLAEALDKVATRGGFLCLINPPPASAASPDDLASAFMTFKSKAEAIERVPPRRS
jgi:anti-anti-sigma factor